MATHHPSADFLTAHAAGTLPVPQAACVAAHLTYCEKCRRINDQLQAIGGVFFEQLAPTPVSETLLDSVLARLDDPAPLRFPEHPAEVGEHGVLPAMLRRIINGDFSQLVWKKITRSLSISYLNTGDTHYEFALYRIGAGGRIPEHHHGGTEMTLVLEGGFTDAQGTYHPGDFVYRESADIHAPVAIDGEDCICLAVLDAPLKFTRWQYRWMNPFLQLRAG